MSRNFNIWASTLFLAAFASASVAQNAFAYQGRLTSAGVPVNADALPVSFQLFDAAEGGSALGGMVSTSVRVVNGLFTTLVDLSAVPDAFNGQPRWIEVTVDGIALSPRQQLTPTPYASFAYNVADGSITAAKLSSSVFSEPTQLGVWSLFGNAGTTASHYIGTPDLRPFNVRVNGFRALSLEYVSISGRTGTNVLAGFYGNTITSGVIGGTIAGGGLISGATTYANKVTDRGGFVGGGGGNRAGSDNFDANDAAYTSVSGGLSNVASAGYASVVGGQLNNASGFYAFVGGGNSNNAANDGAVVAGGQNNSATGANAAVPGGQGNVAAASYSLAAGYRAKALHNGTFVWGDSTEADFSSEANNQFLVRAAGGVGINTPMPLAALDVNGAIRCTTLTETSDLRFKTSVRAIDHPLERVRALRGVTFDWNRRDHPLMQFPPGRRMGFLAQEVEATLPEVVFTDRLGVKSVSYQAIVPVLVEAVKLQQAQIEAQQTQIEQLLRRIEKLELQDRAR